MKFRAIGHKLYVILDPVEETETKSGIILPDKNAQLARLGTVQSVGEEVKYVKEKNRVLVGFHTGSVVDSPILLKAGVGDTHRIFTESEIWAIVEE